jgi:hypothetical protein
VLWPLAYDPVTCEKKTFSPTKSWPNPSSGEICVAVGTEKFPIGRVPAGSSSFPKRIAGKHRSAVNMRLFFFIPTHK